MTCCTIISAPSVLEQSMAVNILCAPRLFKKSFSVKEDSMWIFGSYNSTSSEEVCANKFSLLRAFWNVPLEGSHGSIILARIVVPRYGRITICAVEVSAYYKYSKC